MIKPANKRSYKFTSLLLKAIIFILSIGYIFQKLHHAHITINFWDIVPKLNSNYFFIAFGLVIINWGIEAFKWKYLIRKLEPISMWIAGKSILAGVAISIFTPNRIGEFAGRVFYLKKADKVTATMISLIGSAFQLSITILTGTIASIIYYAHHKNEPFILNLLSANTIFYSLIVLILFLIAVVFIYIKRNLLPDKISRVLVLFSYNEMLSTFVLSLFRYVVFSVQYYLILRAFAIDGGILNSFLLIAITFFVTSAIPTFAFSELTVRGASLVFFFSSVTNNTAAIISAALTIWLINLAIPALIGAFFIWELKFSEE